MNSQYTTLALYIIVLMIVLFSCDFLNPLIDDNGSLAIRCIIDKNFLSKTSDNSSPLEITRIRCIVYKDGGIKKDFNLTKDGNRFKGSVKLKKGDYDISIEAYDESDFNAYSGRQEGVEVSPIKTTEVTINLEPTEVYLTTKISPLNTGDISKSPDKNSYIYNETVQLTASPSAGYQFDHWEGDLSGTDNIANITLNGNKTVTAVFVTVSETVSIPNTLTGPTFGKVGQILSFVTGGSTSNLGHSLEYRFDWGDGNISNWGSASQNYTFNNVGNYQVKAQARCKIHTNILSGWSFPLAVSISGHVLNITINPPGAGDVTRNPNKTQYNNNESVQLTPNPSTNYAFSHWEEDLSGNSNPVTVTMNSDKNITAVFVKVDETITTPNKPTGSTIGKVGQILSFSTGGSTSNLGHSVEYRFDWGNQNISNWGSASQAHTYNNVENYQVKAQARCQTDTNIISDWSSPLTISISGHSLNIIINPTGSGTVTRNPDKVEYNHNEVVQLTPNAFSNYAFSYWEGDLSGRNNPTTITMNNDKNVAAVFVEVNETINTPNQPTGLTTGKVGQILSFSTGGSTSNLGHAVEYRFEWGDGNSSDWGSTSQSHTYDIVDIYQVKAQARCQTHRNIESDLSSPLTVSISGHTLIITISPSGSGSVTTDSNKTQYNHNENVQLTASPSSGYRFDHWDGDLSDISNPANLIMNRDKNVTAVFNLKSNKYLKSSSTSIGYFNWGSNWWMTGTNHEKRYAEAYVHLGFTENLNSPTYLNVNMAYSQLSGSIPVDIYISTSRQMNIDEQNDPHWHHHWWNGDNANFGYHVGQAIIDGQGKLFSFNIDNWIKANPSNVYYILFDQHDDYHDAAVNLAWLGPYKKIDEAASSDKYLKFSSTSIGYFNWGSNWWM
ncbi:MAG: InlB B-repeat-containing protein, partial [bacterium]